jgi:hypothetical protein
MARSVTLPAIERTTAIVGIAATAILYAFVSPAISLGCLLGSAFMIANFFLLAIVGGGILALGRGRGGLSLLGMLLIPLKLIFFLVVSYLLVSRLHVNVPGFVAGVLTQFAAISIEIWRASPRGIGEGDHAPKENKA